MTGIAKAASAVDGPHRFPRVVLNDFTTAKDAARQVRRAWGPPRGPVADVIGSIEAAGGWVVWPVTDPAQYEKKMGHLAAEVETLRNGPKITSRGLRETARSLGYL
ncbi:hypothetical protein ACIBAG_35675 [Streptomyces sp. NPDC051243]|uniref:hypothetical protein n=1 Tax=Streptomyces sp. NPDC051243 TaxID=3365646 RepID=UPI0037A4FE0C